MKDGQRAKYSQDKHCKKVLLATKKAKLVHIVPRRGKPSGLVTFISTMEIRESLQNKVSIDLNPEEENVVSKIDIEPLQLKIDLDTDNLEEEADDIEISQANK